MAGSSTSTGSCTDMMNEPEEYDFKHKVRTTAYPTCELGGIVWAYMGPAEQIPPLPKFAWTQAPEANRHVTKVIEECNWLQALEGGIDTSHAPILHRLLTDSSSAAASSPRIRSSAARRPIWSSISPTMAISTPVYVPWRHRACISASTTSSCRSIRSGRRRSESGLALDAGHIWVPIDDETSMVYNWSYCPGRAADRGRQA